MIRTLGNVAERELRKYKRDDPREKALAFAVFMKNICGVDLYPTQLMDADETFRHTYVLNCKPPRTGKSLGVSGVNMYECYTNELEDLRIYAPKWDQARDTLAYIYNWIDRSKLLKAFIRKKGGKPQLSNSYFELLNGSNAKIYSVRGEIEGHNVTIMHPEEFDLWQWERFRDDVMRRGLGKNANGMPTRIRITGTIMGQENIHKIATDPVFKKRYRDLRMSHEGNILDIDAGIMMNIYACIEFGIIDEEFVDQWKDQVSPDEWARSALLKFTESKNFIWSSYLLALMKKAIEWQLEGVDVRPGGEYGRGEGEENRGTVAFGLDCGHAGESKDSSKYVLQVVEKRGRYRRWLYAKEWDPRIDIQILVTEIMDILRFFRPEGGFGDALNHTLISMINQKAFDEGLTNIDHTEFDGNSPSSWKNWWFSPLHNNGMNKHYYYDSLQKNIHATKFWFPYYENKDSRHIAKMCKNTLRSITNIRKEENKTNYPTYKPLNPKISDDPADALGMANFWIDMNTDEPIDFKQIYVPGKERVTAGLGGSIISGLDVEREDYGSF